MKKKRKPENRKSENHKVNRFNPEKIRGEHVPNRGNGGVKERFLIESPYL